MPTASILIRVQLISTGTHYTRGNIVKRDDIKMAVKKFIKENQEGVIGY